MDFKAKVVGRTVVNASNRLILDRTQLKDADYSNRTFDQVCTIGCRLERCSFEKSRIASAQFGSGRSISEFVECNFDGARVEMGAGGYTRFTRCSFKNVDLRRWKCFTVELVDCSFSGNLRCGVFDGRVPIQDRGFLGRDRNEFSGNDFSSMNLIDVAFRGGIDLGKQQLPQGAEYLYLPNALRTLSQVQSELFNLDAPVQEAAKVIFNGLMEDVRIGGQHQLLLRAADYASIFPYGIVDLVFKLLRERST